MRALRSLLRWLFTPPPRPATEDEASFAPEMPVELPLDGVLDLHTFHPRDVPYVVRDYIRACQAANVLALRIIHGKGKGVQREIVIGVLNAMPEVAAHRPAEPHRGGWGARLVDLHPR